MLRKKDFPRIMQSGYSTGQRDVGHFDNGAGFVGPQHKNTAGGLGSFAGKNQSGSSKKVSMKHFRLKTDQAGRASYTKSRS